MVLIFEYIRAEPQQFLKNEFFEQCEKVVIWLWLLRKTGRSRKQPTTENRATYDIQIYYTCYRLLLHISKIYNFKSS
jgi:hypothetical protein